jgi:hypothetical protein
MCSTQAAEVFQSSLMSWSSKIIAVGTVDSSQRSTGSPQASQYSRVYSSKSATSRPGGWRGSRRERMNACTSSEVSSA